MAVMPDFFDPTPEERVIVLVEQTALAPSRTHDRIVRTLQSRRRRIPFDNILDSRHPFGSGP